MPRPRHNPQPTIRPVRYLVSYTTMVSEAVNAACAETELPKWMRPMHWLEPKPLFDIRWTADPEPTPPPPKHEFGRASARAARRAQGGPGIVKIGKSWYPETHPAEWELEFATR